MFCRVDLCFHFVSMNRCIVCELFVNSMVLLWILCILCEFLWNVCESCVVSMVLLWSLCVFYVYLWYLCGIVYIRVPNWGTYTRPNYTPPVSTPKLGSRYASRMSYLLRCLFGGCVVWCVCIRVPTTHPPVLGVFWGTLYRPTPVNRGILWVSMVVLSVLSPILWVFYGFLCISGEKIVFLVVLGGIFFSLNRSVWRACLQP